MIFVDYLSAELKHYNSGWYVFCHVKNPQTGKLKRKSIKLNRIKNSTQRKKIARKLVTELNTKLANGWNPFIEQEAPRGYAKLIDALDIFLKTKTREFKSKDSIRSYKSQVEMLKKYILKVLKQPDILVISFDAHHAKKYMDYVYNVKKVSNRTFNNYKTLTVTMWNYFIENLYCKSNSFVTIKKKRVGKKVRQIIDLETRKIIKRHLLTIEDYEFLSMVMLCFHGLLRPKEICKLRPLNFNFYNNTIVIYSDQTKDDDNRVISIPSELREALDKLKINEIPKEYYVFSTSFKPGTKQKSSKEVGKRWSKLRKELNMPMEYTFYSLKDSGIVQKLKDGVPPIEVRDQAGHS